MILQIEKLVHKITWLNILSTTGVLCSSVSKSASLNCPRDLIQWTSTTIIERVVDAAVERKNGEKSNETTLREEALLHLKLNSQRCLKILDIII